MLLIAIVFLVSAHSIHSKRVAVARHTYKEYMIMYPESIENIVDVDDDIPRPCREQTYCTIQPKNYPEQIFNEMFKKPTSPALQPSEVIEIYNRFEDNSNEGENGCKFQKQRDPIYKVKPIGDERWRTVAQAPKQGFIQRVRTEKCLNPNANCFQKYTPVADHVTFCHQKYSTFDFLVLKDNNQTELIKVKLPTCCSCRYKKIAKPRE